MPGLDDLGRNMRNTGANIMALGCASMFIMAFLGFIAASVLRGCG